MARNLVDAEDGFLRGKRYVIIDWDPLYTAAFRGILKGAGVKTVRLPAMSPNLNVYAERFVLSIKSECLERMVPLGEGHLRQAISEYMAHYHRERNHQGLGNALIDGEQQDVAGAGRIVRRDGSADCSVSITGRPPSGSGPNNGTGRQRRRLVRHTPRILEEGEG